MEKILNALSNNGFEPVDYLVFVVYIIILVSMGLFLSRSKKGEEKSSTDYFLAGNTLTWWAVGASLIAANISAEQFIGMSGTGYADGIAIAGGIQQKNIGEVGKHRANRRVQRLAVE